MKLTQCTHLWLGHCLAGLCGVLTVLAFAPWELYPLSILSLAGLLYLWLDLPRWQAFWRGWFFGVGLFGAGVYWVFISIHTYGDASILLAFFITVGFIAILALFPAFCGYLLNRYFPAVNYFNLLYAFPALWTAIEWIRSWFCTGFPWLFIGYSQINSPLRGYAPLLSVYGVSYVAALSSALLVYICLRYRQKNYRALCKPFMLLLLFWLIGGILAHITWTHPMGKSIKVSLVQGNIAQELKWSVATILPTLERYEQLSATHWNSQLVIWPESAVPIPFNTALSFIDKMDTIAKKHHTTLITGIPIQLPNGNSYYNALIAVGNGQGFYLKRRLVPFGEYIPFYGALHQLLDILHIPMSDFVPGPVHAAPIQAGDLRINASICYEIAFPELVFSRDPAMNLLLTTSNDAWFGHSIAQAQHLQMGQMRALELGRPALFVSNNGITAMITPAGHIQSMIPPFETAVLTDSIQPMQGRTPWQRNGIDSILIILTFSLIVAIRKRRLGND